MPGRHTRIAAAATLLAAFTVPALAQRAPEVRLTRAEARHPEPFSAITGLRSLPDGRVRVTDGIEESMVRLDATLAKAEPISRSGQGPGEYKTPDALFAIEGGATLLVDLGNGRLSIFDPTGRYKESTPIARGQMGPGMTMVIPRGTDGRGRIYFQPGMRPDGGRADSAPVVRWDRARDVMDTVARVGLPEVKVNTSGGSGNRSVTMRSVPLSPQDAWAVAPDGRVALARAAGYRLEWMGTDGKVARGPANDYRPVPVRDPEKREWMEQAANGLSVMMTNENGRMSVRFGRGGSQRSDPDPSQYEWPASKPPFSAVMVSAEGEAWVERSVAAGSPRVYDVFGPAATMTRSIVLPAGRRVVGFGPGVVYAQQTDQDGLQYLERYRIP